MKDYAKKTPQPSQPKKQDYGVWISLALIVFAVSFVAYATYHAMHRKASVEKEKLSLIVATPSDAEKNKQAEESKRSDKKIPIEIKKALPTKPAKSPHADSKVNSDKTNEPKYDFYTLLPAMTVEVPAQDQTTDGTATTLDTQKPTKTEKHTLDTPKTDAKTTESAATGIYVLQVASLRSASDAAHVESLLRETGYNTFIQHYQTDNHETWYRVMVGPFHSIKEADDAQSKLYAHQMEAILLKKN